MTIPNTNKNMDQVEILICVVIILSQSNSVVFHWLDLTNFTLLEMKVHNALSDILQHSISSSPTDCQSRISAFMTNFETDL